jgi:predicted transcriptional regulator
MRKVKVGIMPTDQFRQRTIDIAAGRYRPSNNEPKIWFHSFKAMGEVLNEKNIELLKIIIEQKPETMTELAKLTDRKLPGLSRTMKTLRAYKLADVKKKGRVRKPTARTAIFNAVNYNYEVCA